MEKFQKARINSLLHKHDIVDGILECCLRLNTLVKLIRGTLES